MDSFGPHPSRRALGAVLAAAALVAGCGAQAREEPPPTSAWSPSVPASPPTKGPVRVSGTVVAGVEPGCLLLETGTTQQYLLVGGDRELLEPGRWVTVSGTANPGTPTTCMQGVPLDVTDVRPAG